jgi:hypothetical protein
MGEGISWKISEKVRWAYLRNNIGTKSPAGQHQFCAVNRYLVVEDIEAISLVESPGFSTFACK